MTSLRRPTPLIEPGTSEHRLLRAVLGVEAPQPHIRRIRLVEMPRWTASLLDTGGGDLLSEARDLTFHVLWQLHEENAAIAVDGAPYPIAPGDTMSVPAGAEVVPAPRMLLAMIEASTSTLRRVIPPSHGEESFEGYNRRTTYETPDAFTMERWKITQPLPLPASPVPFAIIDLADPLGMAWRGGVDLIGRGECRLIEPETGPVTLLPDGLGYALVIRERG